MKLKQRWTLNLMLLKIIGVSLFQLSAMLILFPWNKKLDKWNREHLPSLIALIDATIPMSHGEENTVRVLTKYKETLGELIPQHD